jgi:tungstate transport system substrate-binding protein
LTWRDGGVAGRRYGTLLPLLMLSVAAGPLAAQRKDILLATTTSVRDAGLLDAILPAFERTSGYQVKVIAVGSGQAMELGRRGEADILILHDPAGEERFMADGCGVEREPLAHNEFVLVGPRDDPAGARGTDAVRAMRAIAAAGATFISRGDRSGTHVKELALGQAAGVTPERRWYRETGQGMGATLVVADQLRGYTLTDVATYLSHKGIRDLTLLVEGDTLLRNFYHVVRANPERFPRVNAAGARALEDYLLSPETMRAIGEFGRSRFGRSLFVPAR